jgi:hypothetical protein
LERVFVAPLNGDYNFAQAAFMLFTLPLFTIADAFLAFAANFLRAANCFGVAFFEVVFFLVAFFFVAMIVGFCFGF